MIPRCPECGQRQLLESKLCPACIGAKLDKFRLTHSQHAEGNGELRNYTDMRGDKNDTKRHRERMQRKYGG